MDEPTKRAWSTPELIVLVRSGPEEAVLVVCKQSHGGAGPQLYDTGCYLVDQCVYGQCNSTSPS